jgi:hypothetical protein
MELFHMDSVPELNTINLGNSPSFLTITHTTLSSKQFRCYRLWKIDFAAEFFFWTEQRLNRTQLLGSRLTEALEVPNTFTVGNSLSFLMVHNRAPIGQWFMSYYCRKLNRSAESEIWADYTFQHKSGIWQNFAMTSQETLNIKIAANELSFPLVTHTAHSNARCDRYRILKTRQGAELIWTEWRDG